MTELDAALVRRKLAVIGRNLEDLATVENLQVDEHRADRFRQKGTERLLQETVEAAVDANLHVLRATGRVTPADYYESFIELGRHQVIPTALADRLEPAAGLRNRLVGLPLAPGHLRQHRRFLWRAGALGVLRRGSRFAPRP